MAKCKCHVTYKVRGPLPSDAPGATPADLLRLYSTLAKRFEEEFCWQQHDGAAPILTDSLHDAAGYCHGQADQLTRRAPEAA